MGPASIVTIEQGCVSYQEAIPFFGVNNDRSNHKEGFHVPLKVDKTFLDSICYGFKSDMLIVGFLLVRSTVSRYRFDQLNRIGWRVLMPMGVAGVPLI